MGAKARITRATGFNSLAALYQIGEGHNSVPGLNEGRDKLSGVMNTFVKDT